MTDTEQTAQRLHLYIHQLQNSAIRLLETEAETKDAVIEKHADLLRVELKRLEHNGQDPARALMTLLLMEGSRI